MNSNMRMKSGAKNTQPAPQTAKTGRDKPDSCKVAVLDLMLLKKY